MSSPRPPSPASAQPAPTTELQVYMSTLRPDFQNYVEGYGNMLLSEVETQLSLDYQTSMIGKSGTTFEAYYPALKYAGLKIKEQNPDLAYKILHKGQALLHAGPYIQPHFVWQELKNTLDTRSARVLVGLAYHSLPDDSPIKGKAALKYATMLHNYQTGWQSFRGTFKTQITELLKEAVQRGPHEVRELALNLAERKKFLFKEYGGIPLDKTVMGGKKLNELPRIKQDASSAPPPASQPLVSGDISQALLNHRPAQPNRSPSASQPGAATPPPRPLIAGTETLLDALRPVVEDNSVLVQRSRRNP